MAVGVRSLSHERALIRSIRNLMFSSDQDLMSSSHKSTYANLVQDVSAVICVAMTWECIEFARAGLNLHIVPVFVNGCLYSEMQPLPFSTPIAKRIRRRLRVVTTRQRRNETMVLIMSIHVVINECHVCRHICIVYRSQAAQSSLVSCSLATWPRTDLLQRIPCRRRLKHPRHRRTGLGTFQLFPVFFSSIECEGVSPKVDMIHEHTNRHNSEHAVQIGWNE